MANLAGQQTLTNIQDRIAAVLFNQGTHSTTSYPTTAMINALINSYYKRIYSKIPSIWDKTDGDTSVVTVNGTKNIVMPDACMNVTNITIDNLVRKLIRYNREKFKSVAPGGWTNVGNAVPVYFVESSPASNNALTFDLWPAPDAIYTLTIDYYKRVAALSSGSDVSILPPEFDDALVYGPLSDLLMMLTDSRAGYYKQEFEAIMKNLWLFNERQTDGLLTWRDSATENLNVPWPGLVQPYAP